MAWPLVHIFLFFNEIITRSYHPNDLFCPFLTFTTNSHHLLWAPGRRQAIIAGGAQQKCSVHSVSAGENLLLRQEGLLLSGKRFQRNEKSSGRQQFA